MADSLDAHLKERLRAVRDRGPVTEAELRRLADEGHACERLLEDRLARGEERIRTLAADPESSLSDIAAALREVQTLRPTIAELQNLLDDLHARAREFRKGWLSPPSP